MRLIYTSGIRKGQEVSQGDGVHTALNGQSLIGVVTGFFAPRSASDLGKVYILRRGHTYTSAYSPSVIEAEWIDQEGEEEKVGECA